MPCDRFVVSAEIARLDVQLARLVAAAAPQLMARPGIGTQIAGQLLVTAGDNPTRLRSEGAFAMLVGTAPVPASSGKTERTVSTAVATARPTPRSTCWP